MIDLAKLMQDHGLAAKVEFLHQLADHLRNLAADPAGVQDLAGRIKNIAHHLEAKLADGLDALATDLGDPRPEPVVPPVNQDPAPTTPPPPAATGSTTNA